MYVPRTVDYGMISSQAARAKTNENLASMNAQADVVGAGIAAESNVEQNKLAAEAKTAQAQADAGASKFGAIMGGIGSLTEAFGSMGKSSPSYTSYGNLDLGIDNKVSFNPGLFKA